VDNVDNLWKSFVSSLLIMCYVNIVESGRSEMILSIKYQHCGFDCGFSVKKGGNSFFLLEISENSLT